MIATKQVDLRANLKKYFDIAFSGAVSYTHLTLPTT